MGPDDAVPVELMKEVSIVSLPLPGIEELRQELHDVLARRKTESLELTADQEEHLLQAVMGLTAGEARKAFSRAIQGRDPVVRSLYAAYVSETRDMVQGSVLLEFFDLDERIEDIGGWDGLKDWIDQRAGAFSTVARNRGIAYPKGVLLAGVQGCGKGLSA